MKANLFPEKHASDFREKDPVAVDGTVGIHGAAGTVPQQTGIIQRTNKAAEAKAF